MEVDLKKKMSDHVIGPKAYFGNGDEGGIGDDGRRLPIYKIAHSTE